MTEHERSTSSVATMRRFVNFWSSVSKITFGPDVANETQGAVYQAVKSVYVEPKEPAYK